MNAFVPASEPRPVLAALPPGLLVPAGTADVITREGQVRLWWDDTPVDLFLDYAPGLVRLLGDDDPRVERWDAMTS